MTVQRELGNFPTDFEEYFLQWDCVLFFPDPNQANIPLYGHMGDAGSIPCFKHRSCGALVKAESKYPPRNCPHCKVDTKVERKEQKEREIREQEKPSLWLPSH